MTVSFQDLKDSELSKGPLYLVVGHPISHSLSPLMHQTALDYHGIHARYLAVDLSPDEQNEFIPMCNHQNFLGCNITIPYKNTFNQIVDEIEPFAKQIGVINTLVKEDYKLIGYNTDVHGFLEPLHDYSDILQHSRAIIFGTGGASKAVQTALESKGFEELIFVSRNPNQRNIDSEGASLKIVDYNQWQSFAEEAELFINTTPVGMYPNSDETFLRGGEEKYFSGKICYDLIYNPLETEFLRLAKKSGAEIINGLDMLIYQGSRSFELWTGHTFPIEKIRETLLNEMSSKK